ncbi:MAG: pilus assembly protein PilM [Patescibacteria group bacterium]
MFTKSFFNFLPPPDFLRMPHVGLYISDEAIRFIELLQGKQGLELGRCGEKVLYPEVVQSGYINDTNALIKALSEFKKEFGLHFIHTALPEEKIYLFKLKIPNVDEKEIRTNIEFHLAENVPISPNQTIFDYEIIGDGSEKGTIEVNVLALPDKVVNTYLEVFIESGLVPLQFKTEGQAIASVFIKKGDNGTYMIVNTEEKKTGIFIISGGLVRFSSTIVNKETLKNEIDKIRLFWDANDGKERKIEKVIIPINPWTNVFDLNKYIPSLESDNALKYAVPIGLALF